MYLNPGFIIEFLRALFEGKFCKIIVIAAILTITLKKLIICLEMFLDRKL